MPLLWTTVICLATAYPGAKINCSKFTIMTSNSAIVRLESKVVQWRRAFASLNNVA